MFSNASCGATGAGQSCDDLMSAVLLFGFDCGVYTEGGGAIAPHPLRFIQGIPHRG